MTKFKLEPIKQVIIHDLVQENLDNFLHQFLAQGQTTAKWVDGIIIDHTVIYSPEESYKKSIEGTKYYEKLIFVKFQKYSKKVKWNGGNYEIDLLNYYLFYWF